MAKFNVQAVIFDMDGLIFDSEKLYVEAMLSTAREMGLILDRATALATVGIPGPSCAPIWRDAFGDDIDVELFRQKYTVKYELNARCRLDLKDGVLEILDVLDNKKIPRAIATSTERYIAEEHLSRSKIIDRFDAILCLGDYAMPKPHPSPYLKAAEVLGTEASRCLVLEDSQNGMLSAISAGTVAVMIPDLLSPTDQIREQAAAVVESLHDVISLLP